MHQATKALYDNGGYGRFYSGLTAALIQGEHRLLHLRFSFLSLIGPVARFGDTAANTGIRALLQSNPILRQLPSLGQTVFVSLYAQPLHIHAVADCGFRAAAAFRMILVPIDTLKTTLQTQGAFMRFSFSVAH